MRRASFFRRQIKTARTSYFRFGRPVGMVVPERHDNFHPNACSHSTAMPRGSSPKHHPAVASYPTHSLRRSATAEDIDAQFRGLRDDCTGTVHDEFLAHTTKHSNSPAFQRAPNEAPKPGFEKRAVNWLKWRRDS
jgi:hypothetical protein